MLITWKLITSSLSICLAVTLRGELCPSLSWEHRKCHSVSFLLLHRPLATGQWFFSMLLCVWTWSHPEKPQEGPSLPGAHETLLPVPSSTQSTESDPMKTASVLSSVKLNRVHSPSSIPFILRDSQAHNTLYSLVLCH